jgi:hypothetical protein
LITIVMSATIAADPRRVWRALTSPSECVAWDERLIAPVDPIDRYPQAGEPMRWRCLLGSVPVLLHDEPRAVIPYQKLRSLLAIGSLHFDQTYTLAIEKERAEGGESGPQSKAPRTRLCMKVTVANSVALVGAIVDRFEVRRMTVDRVDETLRAITKWCENNP